MRSIHSAGDEFPKLNRRYYEQVINPRRERVRALVRAAVKRGEISGEGDPYQAAMMPFASVLINALEDTPVTGDPQATAEHMVDIVLNGIATGR